MSNRCILGERYCDCLGIQERMAQDSLYEREQVGEPDFATPLRWWSQETAKSTDLYGVDRTIKQDQPYNFVLGQHYDFVKPVKNTIELIEMLKLDYLTGHAMKYLARHGNKPGQPAEQDLKKAINVLWRRVYGTWAPFPD